MKEETQAAPLGSYRWIRPLLFRLEPERAHQMVLSGLAWLARWPWLLKAMGRYTSQDPTLEVRCWGLRFPNPIGLAAGLDKDGLALPIWEALGFGFVEMGSLTWHPQEGNPRPRLFRIPHEQALINRMGFNNRGVENAARRLSQQRLGIPLGINIGKSRITPLEEAAQEYVRSLQKLWPYGDYFVLNLSSPNTPGLRQLQEADRLRALLRDVLPALPSPSKPLLLKLAPELTEAELEAVLEVVAEFHLSGLVATNTTTRREGTSIKEPGGLSGRPLAADSLRILRLIRSRLPSLPVISVGGIFSLEDLQIRLAEGASLVQIYTGLIYRGPALPRHLCQGLRFQESTLQVLDKGRLKFYNESRERRL